MAISIILTASPMIALAVSNEVSNEVEDTEKEVEQVEVESSKEAESIREAAKKELERQREEYKKAAETTRETQKKIAEISGSNDELKVNELLTELAISNIENRVEIQSRLREETQNLKQQREILRENYKDQLEMLREQTKERREELKTLREQEMEQLRERRRELESHVGEISEQERGIRVQNINKLAPKVANRLELSQVRLVAISEKIQTKLDSMDESEETTNLEAQLAQLVSTQEDVATLVNIAQQGLLDITYSDNAEEAAKQAAVDVQTAVDALNSWKLALQQIVSTL